MSEKDEDTQSLDFDLTKPQTHAKAVEKISLPPIHAPQVWMNDMDLAYAMPVVAPKQKVESPRSIELDKS